MLRRVGLALVVSLGWSSVARADDAAIAARLIAIGEYYLYIATTQAPLTDSYAPTAFAFASYADQYAQVALANPGTAAAANAWGSASGDALDAYYYGAAFYKNYGNAYGYYGAVYMYYAYIYAWRAAQEA